MSHYHDSNRMRCTLRFHRVLVVVALFVSSARHGFAQGCVASRGTGMTTCQYGTHLAGDGGHEAASGFQGSLGYRWLHSDRMFINDVEQKQRAAEGSQEINDSTFLDLGVTYTFNPRFSASLTLPFSVQDRSQVVRALNLQRTIIERFHTRSAGIGDIRMEGNVWVLDPVKHMKGNVLMGLGVSLPTGDRNVQGVFEIPFGVTPRAQTHALDQSIQLGNGGWGFIVDLYAYREIFPRLNAFLSGFYTITPEQKYTPSASLSGAYSIADSYLGRGGFEYMVWPKRSLSLSLAGRIDGVPIHDLVGGSDGFRRPGYSVSIEPGLRVEYKSYALTINTPIAVYRNREQSVSERSAGIAPVAASFADLIVTFSLTKRF
ncbi:MAG: hypothetical protein HY299_12270 [Verrucomicrobia bacterium]|nr:hypothetical protein [Verrucomicrobiota bacterium]